MQLLWSQPITEITLLRDASVPLWDHRPAEPRLPTGSGIENGRHDLDQVVFGDFFVEK